MKSRLLLVILFFAGLGASQASEPLSGTFSKLGDLMVVPLASAPFPHPDRAQGHTYNNERFTAEKSYSDNRVAIFVPKGFRRTEQTDFVVHFHGWRHNIETTLAEYKLIEQFARSGRNAILVVPQGPHDAPDSFGGKLEDENGFKRFVADVVTTLQQRRAIRSERVGDIILSGHSGGYQVMSSILARGGLSDHVREVWLFDALYARTDKFTDWFNRFNGRRLIDIYTLHGGTKAESEKLMASLAAAQPPTPFLATNETDLTGHDLQQNRLLFIYSDLEHNQVVFQRDEFYRYLKTSRLPPINFDHSPKAAQTAPPR